MAWAAGSVSGGGGTSKTAGTTITVGGISLSVGETLLAFVVMDNTGTSTPTVSSIAKPGGETNSWTRIASVNSSSATSGAGVRGEIWAIVTTVAWSSFAPTPTFSASITAKGITFGSFTGGASTLTIRGGTATLGGSSTGGTPSHTLAGGAIPQTDDLLIELAVHENNTQPTNTSPMSNTGTALGTAANNTTGGSASTNVGQSFVAWPMTGTPSGSSAPTCVGDSGTVLVALQPAVTGDFTGAGNRSTTSSITATGGTSGAGDRSETVNITATGSTGLTKGANSVSESVSISASGGGAGSASVQPAVGITASGSVGAAPSSAPVTETVTVTATGGTTGAANRSETVAITATGATGIAQGAQSRTETVTVTATGGTTGSTSRSETVSITAAGGTTGAASRSSTVGITASGSVDAIPGSATRSETVNITASGVKGVNSPGPVTETVTITASGSAGYQQSGTTNLVVGITASGSVTQAVYYFTPPVYQVQASHGGKRLSLSRSDTVLRRNGVLVSFTSPSSTMLEDAGEEGIDWFGGGRRYAVNADIAAELEAAGYEVSPA